MLTKLKILLDSNKNINAFFSSYSLIIPYLITIGVNARKGSIIIILNLYNDEKYTLSTTYISSSTLEIQIKYLFQEV